MSKDKTQVPEQEAPKVGRDKPEVEINEKQPRKAVVESLKAEKPYSVRMWAGKIPVYVCNAKGCGLQRDDEERMILHVLEHYPQEEREKLFDQLVKEMKHE
jgi:hypothetical protein